MLVEIDTSNDAQTNTDVTQMTADESKMAKLYTMMSRDLYADKHLSILRELASNCQDAHREAGTLDIAFTITAPTQMRPYLTFSDQGTGLTYEKAQSSILMFLGSTKDQGENAADFIGGWGIGAKSPRAYSPNYTLRLRKDGIEYTVQVFDKKGFPHHTLMLEEPTKKPNGVDFVIPVSQIDIKLWRDKIAEYMSYTNYNIIAYMDDGEVIHPVKPIGSIDYGDFILDAMGEFKRFRRSGDESSVDLTYGGMLYNIPKSYGLEETIKNITKKLAPGISMRIRVDKPNAVTFGMARESLDNEPQTVDFVTRAVLKVAEAFKASTDIEGVQLTPKTWEELLADNAMVEKKEREQRGDRLAKYMKASQITAKIYLEGLKHASWTYKGSQYELRSVGMKSFVLPMQEEEKNFSIKVLYSDKNPTKSDWADAAKSDTVVQLQGKFSNESDARTAFETEYSKLAGIAYEMCYVKSTRGKRTGGGGGATGQIFAVCEKTGKRTQIVDGKNYVMLDKEWQEWVGNDPDTEAFWPTASFLKRKDIPENVMNYSDFMELDSTEELLHEIRLSQVSPETLEQMRTARGYLEGIGGLPGNARELHVQVSQSLETQIDLIVSHKVRFNRLVNGVPDGALLIPMRANESQLPLLKAANDLVVLWNKIGKTCEVIDFHRLERKLKSKDAEMAAEAKRIVTILQLEQYYE